MSRSPFFGEFPSRKEIASRLPELKSLRSFTLVNVLGIALVALSLGLIATRAVVDGSIQRNALLTAQFIQALGATQASSHELPGHQINEVLDPRQDSRFDQREQMSRQKARRAFFNNLTNLAMLPDSLLIHVFAPDNVVLWSSNSALIDQRFPDNEELEAAVATKNGVVASYREMQDSREEQKFSRKPKNVFIENYIPLVNATGQVVSVVEFYTEPGNLIARTRLGYVVLWLAISLGGVLVYQALYSIVRHNAGLLHSREKQPVDNEASVMLGEMSTVVAHNLRNPLAAVRSSAELTIEMVTPAASKHIRDIIEQVDRMSKWIRDLLLASSPLKGIPQEINPAEVILETLRDFKPQMRNSKVRVKFAEKNIPPVLSERALLSWMFNTLVSNAMGAMPNGGLLHIEITPDTPAGQLFITFHDSGTGMTAKQQQQLFRPCCSTKQGGLGIGLVMVKLIMERFGGRVSLTSSEGKGTSVSLCFRIERRERS